jgi:hypothetical protein
MLHSLIVKWTGLDLAAEPKTVADKKTRQTIVTSGGRKTHPLWGWRSSVNCQRKTNTWFSVSLWIICAGVFYLLQCGAVLSVLLLSGAGTILYRVLLLSWICLAKPGSSTFQSITAFRWNFFFRDIAHVLLHCLYGRLCSTPILNSRSNPTLQSSVNCSSSIRDCKVWVEYVLIPSQPELVSSFLTTPGVSREQWWWCACEWNNSRPPVI